MALSKRIFLAPHFPALLNDTARDQEAPIHAALRRAGAALDEAGVQVMVAMSAGWAPEGPFQVDNGLRHKTLLDFQGVDTSLRYSCDGWAALANALHENGILNGLPVETVHRGMDHSASVPLHYMFPDADRRVVTLSASERSRKDMNEWGAVVRETCRGTGAIVGLFAGGSLSYDPEAHGRGEDRAGGVELDRAILGRLEAGDWDGLAAIDDRLLENGAAHVALRHLWFLEGVLGKPVAGHVLAHHRYPSVGSALVEFEVPT